MALLYPWATKEYLLWNMTIGQIILYHNKGIAIKNGDTGEGSNGPGLVNKPVEELRKMRDDARAQFEAEDILKKQMAEKYGDI